MEIKSAVRSHYKTSQKCLACGNTRVCQIKSLVASMTVVCGGLNTQRGHRTVHERIQSSGTMRGRLMLSKNIAFKFYRPAPPPHFWETSPTCHHCLRPCFYNYNVYDIHILVLCSDCGRHSNSTYSATFIVFSRVHCIQPMHRK